MDNLSMADAKAWCAVTASEFNPSICWGRTLFLPRLARPQKTQNLPSMLIWVTNTTPVLLRYLPISSMYSSTVTVWRCTQVTFVATVFPVAVLLPAIIDLTAYVATVFGCGGADSNVIDHDSGVDQNGVDGEGGVVCGEAVNCGSGAGERKEDRNGDVDHNRVRH